MAKKYDLSSLEGVKRIFNEAVEEMAHEVLWRIENIYETAIDRFYADYNPLYYNRTFSTYLGSSGYEDTFSPQNIKKIGDAWESGITISDVNIPGKPYRADTEWVFDRTFNKGIHGINAGKVFGKDTTKRFQRVIGNKVFETIIGTSVNGTLQITKRKKYYQGDIQVQQRELTNMSPTPRGIIGKEFRALTRQGNMKKMFNNILSGKLK